MDLSDQELVRYRRTGVGFVFQFFNLVPTLTSQENVEPPMRLASTPAAQRKERTKELLDLVGLAGRRVRRPDGTPDAPTPGGRGRRRGLFLPRKGPCAAP